MHKVLNGQTKPIALFTFSYLLVAGLAASLTSNWEFLYYIVVVLVLAAAAMIVHVHVGLTTSILWYLSIWGLLHMVGGLVPIPFGIPYSGTKAVFYSMWIVPDVLKYDQVVHAYGFGVATWLCWQAVVPTLKDSVPRFGILALCVFGGMGLGALNEVVEFTAVLLVPETNVGGYTNTGWDLVSNMVGCITAAYIIWWTDKRLQQ